MFKQHLTVHTWALKALVRNVSLMVGGLFVALLLSEMMVRAYEVRIVARGAAGWELMAVRRIVYQVVDNEALNYMLKPDMQYNFENVHVVINSQGLRGDLVSEEKPPGVYRILGLGDSVTFGWQVRFEETYLEQLESMLNASDASRRYEVINAGVPGYNLGNELVYLREHGVRYGPDLVIVGFSALNDADGTRAVYIADGNIAYVPLDSSSAPTDSGGVVAPLKGFLRRKSHLYHFVTQEYGMLRERWSDSRRTNGTAYHWPFPLEEEDDLWELIRSQISEIQDVAEQHGARLLVVTFPMLSQVTSEDAPLVPQEVLADLARQIGVPVVDALPAFRGYGRSPVFADDFSHPSAFGHQLVAKEIFSLLQEMGIVAR
jgi:lysophospholipase L1-like esterase